MCLNFILGTQVLGMVISILWSEEQVVFWGFWTHRWNGFKMLSWQFREGKSLRELIGIWKESVVELRLVQPEKHWESYRNQGKNYQWHKHRKVSKRVFGGTKEYCISWRWTWMFQLLPCCEIFSTVAKKAQTMRDYIKRTAACQTCEVCVTQKWKSSSWHSVSSFGKGVSRRSWTFWKESSVEQWVWPEL